MPGVGRVRAELRTHSITEVALAINRHAPHYEIGQLQTLRSRLSGKGRMAGFAGLVNAISIDAKASVNEDPSIVAQFYFPCLLTSFSDTIRYRIRIGDWLSFPASFISVQKLMESSYSLAR